MALEDDPWVKSKESAARFHAMGVLILRWNNCEMLLKAIAWLIFGLEKDRGWLITHDMPVPSLAQKIVDYVEHFPSEGDLREEMKHAVDLFNANRLNRNQLTHFYPDWEAGPEGYAFLRAKGPRYQFDEFPSSAADIRRVADEVGACAEYLSSIWGALEMRGLYAGSRRPSLQRPPLPARLWSPPPPTPTK